MNCTPWHIPSIRCSIACNTLSSRQKEFVGNAAHELKSPLTILMLGHEEMLAAEPPETLQLELEKQLHTMRRLSKLVRNLLEISRLEQNETCAREHCQTG